MLPYRDIDGVVIGMIAGWLDISERQRLLGHIEDAKNVANDANKAKTKFLATLSHEIRTPMNAVIGMLELALKKLTRAYSTVLRLRWLQAQPIGRIESGKLSLTPERANLLELVTSLARVFEGLAEQKHLQRLLDLDVKADGDVLIDPLRF